MIGMRQVWRRQPFADFKITVPYGEELLLSKSVVQVWREKGSLWETKINDVLKEHNKTYAANDESTRLWDPSMDIESGQKRPLDGEDEGEGESDGKKPRTEGINAEEEPTNIEALKKQFQLELNCRRPMEISVFGLTRTRKRYTSLPPRMSPLAPARSSEALNDVN